MLIIHIASEWVVGRPFNWPSVAFLRLMTDACFLLVFSALRLVLQLLLPVSIVGNIESNNALEKVMFPLSMKLLGVG